ncbi:MAG: alpha-amylase family glycosyl hydrolase, partial [Bacteroidales bacterium]
MKRTSFASILLILLVISTSCSTKQVAPVQQGPFTSVVHPDWIKSAVMYEVNVRQYTPEGTFNAFSEKLPRLKELGVDILWLMPINPIGVINRKGPLGSYYSVKDYKGINPEFGTMDDFKALVKRTHELGMYLII